MSPAGHRSALRGHRTGHSTVMGIALVIRTLILGMWLAGLVWHGDFSAETVLLTTGIVVVWAAPLLRDSARHRAVAWPATRPERAVP
jgi:hypothetical protein